MIDKKKRVMVNHNTPLNVLRAAKLYCKNTELNGENQVISSPTNGGNLE